MVMMATSMLMDILMVILLMVRLLIAMVMAIAVWAQSMVMHTHQDIRRTII